MNSSNGIGQSEITRLKLSNFKAFKSFDLRFKGDAFLVGPNNAGKSTLIEALRGGSLLLKQAAKRRPTKTRQDKGNLVWCYDLPSSLSEIEEENLRHDFKTAEARLEMELSNLTVLAAVWPPVVDEYGNATMDRPFFYVNSKGARFLSRDRPPTWREHHVEIGVVPTLAPLLNRETLLSRDYVMANIRTRRVSQHLRNHLYRLDEDGEFDEFVAFALQHLPEVDQLEVDTRPNEQGEVEIDVYYRERGQRVPKEICWAGDGLQIYIQLLWFAWHYRKHQIVVFDEPDVFLHADLQRRLVRVFETLCAQVITATHSPEMLAEAADESVLWVDKTRKSAIRRPDPATLEDLSTQIGTGFNLRLASALRANAVIFVEGKDMKLLRLLAKTVGAFNLYKEIEISTIPLGGFTRWVGVEPFKWLIDGFLGKSVEVAVVLDRDYKSASEVIEILDALSDVGVQAHIWERCELENYLISPAGISRLVPGLTEEEVSELILESAADLAADFQSQYGAQLSKSAGKKDPATVFRAAIDEFNSNSHEVQWCVERLPGKDLLASLNRTLQKYGHKAVSHHSIASSLRRGEIPPEMNDLLLRFDRLGDR